MPPSLASADARTTVVRLPGIATAAGSARPARTGRRATTLASALLVGPGLLAMLGENDGPSMLSYAASGAAYGIGFFLPFILVTFAAAYVVQEMAMRLGAVTGRGYGELINQRFGRSWGWISTIDLIATNFITLISEVIAIRLGMGFFGIPAWGAVLCAIALVAYSSLGGRYARWERICAGLAVFNLVFVVVAVMSHPSLTIMSAALVTWAPFPHAGLTGFLMLIASNIGATVTPWMLFFQQSASVDKGMAGAAAIRTGRVNTAIGAGVAAICGVAALIAAAPLFTHGIDMRHYGGGIGFAEALQPLLGHAAASLFALGLIEAGAVALLTISASGAYAAGEMIQGSKASFNSAPSEAPLFHAINIGMTALAALVVLIPGAPLLAIALNANLLATILMPAALVFLLLLTSDAEVMGRHANSRSVTIVGSIICAVITIAATAATVFGFLGVFKITL